VLTLLSEKYQFDSNNSFFILQSPDDELLKKNILDILMNIEEVPEEYQTQIRNNAGG